LEEKKELIHPFSKRERGPRKEKKKHSPITKEKEKTCSCIPKERKVEVKKIVVLAFKIT
jgi:hypothetical protein